MTRLIGVEILDPHDEKNFGLSDIIIENGHITAIQPSKTRPARRLLAMPALANAHDHARPLSTSSFGAAGKPLESWLLRLGAMPAIDPYLGAPAAFGRAARAGAASVIAHYTRLNGPMPALEEACEVARAARDIGIRVTFALFMRDRNPLVYGDAANLLASLPDAARATVEAQFFSEMPGIADQIARIEAIAAAVEGPMFSVQFGPSGPQWCSDAMLRAIADASARTGRRVHMHLLETQYQRAYLDEIYPQGILPHLADTGLLSPRLTLAHCVHARPDELDSIAAAGATIATNPSSNLHLRSGIAPVGEALKRGCRVAIGVDASAFDEDDDILREMRLGHFLHGGWGFNPTIDRAPWLKNIVTNGRFANGAPGTGALKAGEPADLLVLNLDMLDRDAIMPVEPVDLLFGRATRAHIDQLFVNGREIVRQGRLTGIDLEAVEANLRIDYRRKMPGRIAFLNAWPHLEPKIAAFYRDLAGCC